MDETSNLNSLAKAEIEKLESEGIKPTPEDVVELNALGWAIHTPETRRLLSRGRPIPLGSHWLWPLTMRAVEWMKENGYPLDTITPAMGYAMAHGRSEGHELDTTGRQADKAVKGWFRSLRVTRNEFVEAVQQVDAQESRPTLPPNPDGKPMSLGDFCAFLSFTCGADPEFWERRCSIGFCFAMMATRAMQNHHDKHPCAQDPVLIAERAMGYAIEKIRARHKNGN